MPPEFISWDREQINKELKAAEEAFRTEPQAQVYDRGREIDGRHLRLNADYVAEQMRAADLLITTAEEGGALLDRSRHVSVTEASRLSLTRAIATAAIDRSVPPDSSRWHVSRGSAQWR